MISGNDGAGVTFRGAAAAGNIFHSLNPIEPDSVGYGSSPTGAKLSELRVKLLTATPSMGHLVV